ncbi:MAG: TetR family transcriptional regulator C-terminal domain-containing protein [Aquaticitalea sp.]
MAKKKKLEIIDLVTFYMDDVVKLRSKPESIEEFAKTHNFDDALFYNHFESFKDLEQHIFKLLFENSLEVLEQSDEYAVFDRKNKLISLYYTFFENLSLNREFVVLVLEEYKNILKTLSILSELKVSFTIYIDTLNLDDLSLNIDLLEGVQKTTIRESAWIQLLFTMKFWLDDKSPDFEKTDVFIEKSLNTSLDLLDTKTLNNLIDLGKFLYKEKFQSS